MNVFQKILQYLQLPTSEVNRPNEKAVATAKGEPYVSVTRVTLDKDNPRYGSFELDWNNHFVMQLMQLGYVGDSHEQIVDQWFQDVCRHVVLESYEQEQANVDDGANVVRYVNRRPADNGRTEVS